jgi:hypothetical protein
MAEQFNVYCDESCHLPNDRQRVFVLGAVWASEQHRLHLFREARNLKRQFGLSESFELKWGKVSQGRADYYDAVLRWFWQNPALHFRGLIVPDKGCLSAASSQRSSDDWYYRMLFDLLKVVVDPTQRYRVYMDIKDTRGRRKVARLREVLRNAHYDFSRSIIERVQLVRSDEVELVQLADFLIGILSYANRGLQGNRTKLALVQTLKDLSGYSLLASTLLRENKLNLFRWRPQGEP